MHLRSRVGVTETWSGATRVHAGVSLSHITVESRAGLQSSDLSGQSSEARVSAVSGSVSQSGGPPALTTPPSQRAAPLPSVNTSTEYSRRHGVWVWSLKVARKSRSGIGNGIGNILESLSTLSRLVSRSRERTFLCTSDPIHMRCGRLLHTADVCSRTQTTTDKPPRLSIVSRRSKFHGRLLAQRCLLLPSIHGQRSSPLAAACQLPALGRRSSAPRAGAAQQ